VATTDDPAANTAFFQLLLLVVRNNMHGGPYMFVRYDWRVQYAALVFPNATENALKGLLTGGGKLTGDSRPAPGH
jgi:hypothetical protein